MAWLARSTANFWDKKTPYENWIESTGAPIHHGYYIEDCRTVELGYWAERECDAAFIQLAGQEGVTGAYVTEIPPGKTLPSFRVAVDEVVYVLKGRLFHNLVALLRVPPTRFGHLFLPAGSPAYLWPFDSCLSSVPNLVGRDTVQ